MSDSSYEWLGEDDELTGEKDKIAKEIMGDEYMTIKLMLIRSTFLPCLIFKMDLPV